MKLALSTTKPSLPPSLITNLSPEQSSAVSHITTTSANLILKAYAGSGKTYTLEAILCAINNHFPGASCAYLVFNNKNETEFQARVSRRGILNTTVKTAHKFGKRACEDHLGSFKIDQYKIENLIKAYPANIPWAIQKILSRFISLGKDSGIGIHGMLPNHSDSWRKLYDHHDLDCEDFPLSKFLTIAENILTLSNQSDKLDIADLIYFPLYHGWPIPQYDFVLVDEAQDINSVRRELIRRMLKRDCIHCHSRFGPDMPDECQVKVGEACHYQTTGRLIAVGDPHQAIYGFTGADHNALTLLSTTFSAPTLPLSTSCRCSQSVIRHAQKLVPGITALPNAPEGSVTKITEEDFKNRFTTTSPELQHSAVLCRNNAPLIKQAITCLRNRIPCRIEGKDVGKQLLSIIWKLKANNCAELQRKLITYRNEQQQKLSPWKFETLDDKLTCLSLLLTVPPPASPVKEIELLIDRLFSDYDPSLPPTLTFSSVHKSKGLEWHTVYLLGRNTLMPSRLATLPWMLTQELNLIYVAITRAAVNLIEVDLEE